jgi:hypothetical protein
MRDFKGKLQIANAYSELLEGELESVRKELEMLKNTRVRCTSIDIDLMDL